MGDQEGALEKPKIQPGDLVRIKGQRFSPKYTVTGMDEQNLVLSFILFGIYSHEMVVHCDAVVLA